MYVYSATWWFHFWIIPPLIKIVNWGQTNKDIRKNKIKHIENKLRSKQTPNLQKRLSIE